MAASSFVSWVAMNLTMASSKVMAEVAFTHCNFLYIVGRYDSSNTPTDVDRKSVFGSACCASPRHFLRKLVAISIKSLSKKVVGKL